MEEAYFDPFIPWEVADSVGSTVEHPLDESSNIEIAVAGDHGAGIRLRSFQRRIQRRKNFEGLNAATT
jgi:hypothetical protein